ncbi:integrase [Labrys miyagiensis]|uniref:Integrase n=1 Tax=Labrys miyagiensis TaxID=346912 RepID=A0ABQ6CCJ5_9HYPH|nr:site-specific integrase [Labrys miyagiensis]GLS18101.1 integrase [Labrys miyagiensis]
MAREINRLNARSVLSLAKPGRHADGGNLFLVVDSSGAKRWVFLFRWEGKLKEMGLGGLTSVSLARARELATDARAQVADGVNPIVARKAEKPVPTFGEVADDLIKSMSSEWRNEKHREQWSMTLREYAKPLRGMKVNAITTEDVLRTLKPIWVDKPETASRVRGRIERVLDAAKALGHRNGENPAAWRGNLKNLLPAARKLSRGHHAALPYAKLPAFVQDLQKREGVAALALEWTILCAARTGEITGATWAEIDTAAKVWSIPGSRMKAGRAHRVPLSGRAIEILEQAAKVRTDEEPEAFVFPGLRPGRPLSNQAMEMLLRRMKVDVTTHGFRSTFKDWCSEATSTPNEISEMALAHAVRDKVEAAYRRGDLFDRRRQLMESWAAFCITPPEENVVSIGKRV